MMMVMVVCQQRLLAGRGVVTQFAKPTIRRHIKVAVVKIRQQEHRHPLVINSEIGTAVGKSNGGFCRS